jgi:hypothetical protein
LDERTQFINGRNSPVIEATEGQRIAHVVGCGSWSVIAVVLRSVRPSVRIGGLLGIDLPERGRGGTVSGVPALRVYSADASLSAETRIATDAIGIRGA